MDIYQSIKADHDTLRELLDGMTKAPAERRQEAFERFKRELWAHSKVEETVFYTPLRRHDATRMEILEGLNEHHMIDGLLAELDAQPAQGEAWQAKAQVLCELLTHHLKEEEEKIFGEARNVLKDGQARALGESWQERRRKVVDALDPKGIM
ncbi:MAG TPA: hemerythrin domain-containing protein [Arenibaculum sp.]|nr:hemerythrin domain-containing protein [Arenibaculum sp.]